MVEKFNFYDVYGYFLPGCALLALLWLPFGLVQRSWPTEQLASAVALAILAYVAGHLVQIVAERAMPSTIADSRGRSRYPSDVFLDKDDNTFTSGFKIHLSELVKTTFDIDLGLEGSSNEEEQGQITRRRAEAFFLCRAALIREGVAAYAEQMQGMYSLMRGLAAAFALGFAYQAGWFLSGFADASERRSVSWAGLLFLLIATALSFPALSGWFRRKRGWLGQFRIEMGTLVFLVLAFFALGFYFGENYTNYFAGRGILLAIALSSLLCHRGCYTAYGAFARGFAKHVWRDFTAGGLIQQTSSRIQNNSSAEIHP